MRLNLHGAFRPDYYQLPADDKQKLLAEQIAEAEAEEAAEEEAFEREQAARESRHRNREDGEETDHDDDEQPALESVEISVPDMVHEEIAASAAEPFLHVESLTLPEQSLSDLLQDTKSEPAALLQAESFAVHSPEADALPEEAGVSSHPDSVPSHDAFVENSENPEDQLETGETTSEDAEETRNALDRNVRGFHRRYRIQEVIKRNQIVLVQIIKEERGNKGCSLTTFISLAGRCAVLMPNSPKGGGISRKITDRETRRRLKEVASEMRTHRGMSVIIRTAGIDRTKAEIRRDYEYLVKLWNDVRTQTLSSTAPALIYEEGNLIKRSLRDQYSADIEEIIIEGETGFEEAKNFMRMLMPAQANRVKLYKDTMPLFSFAGVEEQLSGMTEPQVKLPSGGYLVINPTEALISIDVNSGRSTSERNVEETALKTNLEAAAEVGRQMRLRDLAGLVVIDFIDMNYGKNRKAVERAMKDAVRTDRAKITLGRISMFGLLELSRQRMRPSIAESMGVPCPHCKGTGHVHSVETIGIQIIRTLEKEGATGDYAVLRISTTPEAALHLLNDKRSMLQSIEQRYGISVMILMDTSLITGGYSLVKVTKEGKEIHHDLNQPSKQSSSSRGRRSRRGGAPNANGGRSLDFSDAVEASTEEFIDEFASDNEEDNEILIPSSSASTEEKSTEARPRRERGERPERGGRNRNRGGRNRNRDRAEREPRVEGDVAADPIMVDGVVELKPEAAPREPRGDRNRRRGRRGGRNRNERGPRPAHTEGADTHEVSTTTDAAIAPTEYKPRGEYTPRPAASSYQSETRIDSSMQPSSYAPRPQEQARVIPLSEAQTNPMAVASPIRSESSDSNAPKRKGWWARVLEN